ncbi:ATP-dependent DNA helicase RecG [bioreactor metagenome]|uniref:ATP-dependent DNA helicase RecG n=1 Tax=bioreactor metagenome TaxID=1076179 RepID=A0A645DYW6_9ZZZZ
MKWQEKESVMLAFKNNEFQVLVSTTVIEVGIDVPNATVMLIEDSERFGLSQLHQLRGRVGRGLEQSYCFLMTKDNFRYKFTGKNAANYENEKISAIIRLKAMQDSVDGFELSEIDLKLRGPGDILGTKQSGIPEFKYADLVNDVEIVQKTSNLAKQIVTDDPNLEKSDNLKLKEFVKNNYKKGNNFINIA